MELMMENDLWFSQLDPQFLCRAGGNGPQHPSQLYAIEKYVKPGESFLDVGCGSGTTYEALEKAKIDLIYVGVDKIKKNVEFCQDKFKDGTFYIDDATNCQFDDNSFDVVYSRHLLEHLPTFEAGLFEQARIAKRLVIIVLWADLLPGDMDQINYIKENGKIYMTEFSNRYSEQNIRKSIDKLKDWKLVEFAKDIGSEARGHDTVIVLEKKSSV